MNELSLVSCCCTLGNLDQTDWTEFSSCLSHTRFFLWLLSGVWSNITVQ